MRNAWSSALVDANYAGAWNKLALLERHLRRCILPTSDVDWLLWMDWDAIVTDLDHELPLEEYERAGARLIVGGDPAGVFTSADHQADYLKLNSGVMILRCHNWTLALVERMLRRGGRGLVPGQRHRRALEVQRSVKNLCVGCIDDQSVLLELLHLEPQRWAKPTYLERRYLLQGFWEDFAESIPLALSDVADSAVPTPLRRAARATALPALRRPVFGMRRVPFTVHFAGCQLCSGKGTPARTASCWPAFRRTLRFGEEQVRS